MKTVLEKFDHSPLWIRLGVLSILFGILITGMVFVQGQANSTRNSVSSAAVSHQAALPYNCLLLKKKHRKKKFRKRSKQFRAQKKRLNSLKPCKLWKICSLLRLQ